MVFIRDIIEFLKKTNFRFEFFGDINETINGFSTLYNYRNGTITWCKKSEYFEANEDVKNRQYNLIVMPEPSNSLSGNYIITDKPKNVFFDIVEEFFATERKLPEVGAGTYISPEVKIGKNVKIGYNCVIDGDITIGDNTVIYHNVTLINRINIGKNCTIQSNVVMGHDDYGYVEDENHNKKMIKHYGAVVIGDDVFIGPSCVINRGTIDDTVVGSGCKIDAFCNIAHNVELGPKSSLISGASIYGSVKTGENVYIASALIKNQLKLGDNVVVGMGSVVLKDLESDVTVAGVPAKPINKF